MPRHLTLFGTPIPRFTSRRLSFLLLCLSLSAFALIITLTSAVPASPSTINDATISVPHFGDSLANNALNPFRQRPHPPPRQSTDRHAGSSWFADWKWLIVPFSKSVTLDEDRALLPPLPHRPAVYCFYDATAKKPRDEKEAEAELLLTWRRAWWAQGFKPVVLSPQDAFQSPLYARFQHLRLNATTKPTLLRLLAWEAVSGGILTHHTLLPMAAHDDPLLSFLRHGRYPQLTQWKGLDALLVGSKDDVGTVMQRIVEALASESPAAAYPSLLQRFTLKESGASLASYSASLVRENYPEVADRLERNPAAGSRSLNTLINAHLHHTWQDRFSDGIDVLKPHPEHTTHLVNGTLNLAQRLAACSLSTLPSSCPPNLPACTNCVPRDPLSVSTPANYRPSLKTFTVGVVPHPWTLAVLKDTIDTMTARWIRRESERDPWLYALTHSLLGEGVSSRRRVISLKELIAGKHATSRSLWFAAEDAIPADVDWYFGFHLPPSDRLKPPPRKPHDPANGPVASARDLAQERPRFERAKKVVSQTKRASETKLRTTLEAWNMADTEAWKFMRAFQARLALERKLWEKGEAERTGDPRASKRRGIWSRWLDRADDNENEKPS